MTKVVVILAMGFIFLSFISSPVEHRQKRIHFTDEDIWCILMSILTVIIAIIVILVIRLIENILFLS